MSELYPALPNVPGAFGKNAPEVIQTRVALFLTYGSPTAFGRSWPMPVSELSAPAPGVKGNPVCTLSRNEGRQVPTMVLTMWLANLGVSYTKEVVKLCRRSPSAGP